MRPARQACRSGRRVAVGIRRPVRVPSSVGFQPGLSNTWVGDSYPRLPARSLLAGAPARGGGGRVRQVPDGPTPVEAIEIEKDTRVAPCRSGGTRVVRYTWQVCALRRPMPWPRAAPSIDARADPLPASRSLQTWPRLVGGYGREGMTPIVVRWSGRSGMPSPWAGRPDRASLIEPAEPRPIGRVRRGFDPPRRPQRELGGRNPRMSAAIVRFGAGKISEPPTATATATATAPRPTATAPRPTATAPRPTATAPRPPPRPRPREPPPTPPSAKHREPAPQHRIRPGKR